MTGHCGLIGTALTAALRQSGHAVTGIDLLGSGTECGDFRDPDWLGRALAGCDGVIHLAAVSRVIDGERYPERCWAVNAEGTRQLVEAAGAQMRRPWLIYASSREVYGDVSVLPVSDDTPVAPVNIYGRSKAAAEEAVLASDLCAAVVRFSNVYGHTADHADRVVPAFCRQAVLGEPLRVDGSGHTFDFTHLSDTVRGLLALAGKLEAGALNKATLHLVTGKPTTLGELAALAVELAASASTIREAPPRNFDVSRFYGDPTKAARLLGWQAEVPLREGMARLIADFRDLGERDRALVAEMPAAV